MKQIKLIARRWLLLIALVALVIPVAWGCGVKGEEVEQGKQALVAYGCSSCHTIPGVRLADGIVGPPLDFWASRWYIAGSLINEPDNLIRWLMDPQAIEPGTAMPQMGVSETDARNMGAYLYTLEAGDRGHVNVRGFTGGTIGALDVTGTPGATNIPDATLTPRVTGTPNPRPHAH